MTPTIVFTTNTSFSFSYAVSFSTFVMNLHFILKTFILLDQLIVRFYLNLGMVFDHCGTSCPLTCSGRQYNCEDRHCIDGCHCPEKTYLQDGVCVKKSACPCEFGNKVMICLKFN